MHRPKSTTPEAGPPDITLRESLRTQQKERTAEMESFLGSIERFADQCTDLDAIRLVLRSLSRVDLPAPVVATIYQQPYDASMKNPIQGSMEAGEKACKTLLKKAFGMAETIADLNKIMACDYRVAGLKSGETEIPNGSLLYGLENQLLATLQSNEAIRAEIVQARIPDSERNETFLHFLFFAKEVQAFEKISPVLLELQAEAFGDRIQAIVKQYD